MNKDLLFDLCNADGISGDEREVRAIFTKACAPYARDVAVDKLGSVAFAARTQEKTSKHPRSLRMLLMAHMDEVGFIVRSISPEGLLHLLAVGGVAKDAQVLQAAHVITADGEKFEGVLSTTSTSGGASQEALLDLGCADDSEIRARGIAEGDSVCFSTYAHCSCDQIVRAKALDDRVGCYVLIEALRRLSSTCLNEVFVAGTVGEEVGARGAQTITRLIQPDIVIVVDVANHAAGDESYRNHRVLGAGPLLEHYDKSLSPNRLLVRECRRLLTEKNIPFQRDLMGGGGTDAGTAHLTGCGVPALVVGVPIRYCHTSQSLCHISDIESTIDAVVTLCSALTLDRVEEMLPRSEVMRTMKAIPGVDLIPSDYVKGVSYDHE